MKKDKIKGHREFYFATQSEEERDVWITTIELLKTIAVHDDFQSSFGAKLIIPLKVEDPVVNLFDKKPSLNLTQRAKTGNEKDIKMSTAQRRQTIRNMGLNILNAQQSSHKNEQDLKERIKVVFNCLFTHLTCHIMDHSFRSKKEHGRGLAQTPKVFTQTNIIESIEEKFAFLKDVEPDKNNMDQLGTIRSNSMIIPGAIEPRKRVELKDFKLTIKGMGEEQGIPMAKIKEEKSEDEELGKIENEKASRAEAKLEKNKKSEENDKIEKHDESNISPEVSPERKVSVNELEEDEEVDESIAHSDNDDKNEKIQVNSSFKQRNSIKKGIPIFPGNQRDKKFAKEDFTSKETWEDNKESSTSKVGKANSMEALFDWKKENLKRKSSILTTASIKNQSKKTGSQHKLYRPPVEKEKYNQYKEMLFVVPLFDSPLISENNEIATVTRVILKQKPKDISIAQLQRTPKNIGSLRKVEEVEQNISHNKTALLAEVQKFVLEKLLSQTDRVKKNPQSKIDKHKLLGSTVKVRKSSNENMQSKYQPYKTNYKEPVHTPSPVTSKILGKTDIKKDLTGKKEDESIGTLSLSSYVDENENLHLSEVENKLIGEDFADDNRCVEVLKEEIVPDNFNPNEDKIEEEEKLDPNNENFQDEVTNQKYGYVIRKVQSIGGDIFELHEDILVTVEKVNEDDNIATCTFNKMTGLFPLDAIRIGSAIKSNKEQIKQPKEVSLTFQENAKIFGE